jgi:integrase
MYLKHGSYYFVKNGIWKKLGRDYREAMAEYTRLTCADSGMVELVDRWLAYKRKGISEGTYEVYSRAADKIKAAFVNFSPEQVDSHDVANFLDMYADTPNAANGARNVLSQCFKIGIRWGLCKYNPVRDVDGFKVGSRTRYLTDKEYRIIRQAASKQLRLLIDMLYLTGQRIGDVLNIKYADISKAQ